MFVEALELILGTDGRIEVVGHALDGETAIRLARGLDPDVVLLDLSMPGIDGFAAIAAMLADDAGRRIVVLSGSADPDDIEKAREAGACDYVLKEQIAADLAERLVLAGADQLRRDRPPAASVSATLRAWLSASSRCSMFCSRRRSSR